MNVLDLSQCWWCLCVCVCKCVASTPLHSEDNCCTTKQMDRLSTQSRIKVSAANKSAAFDLLAAASSGLSLHFPAGFNIACICCCLSIYLSIYIAIYPSPPILNTVPKFILYKHRCWFTSSTHCVSSLLI